MKRLFLVIIILQRHHQIILKLFCAALESILTYLAQ